MWTLVENKQIKMLLNKHLERKQTNSNAHELTSQSHMKTSVYTTKIEEKKQLLT